jgi:hypothetical protein
MNFSHIENKTEYNNWRGELIKKPIIFYYQNNKKVRTKLNNGDITDYKGKIRYDYVSGSNVLIMYTTNKTKKRYLNKVK